MTKFKELGGFAVRRRVCTPYSFAGPRISLGIGPFAEGNAVPSLGRLTASRVGR